MLQFSEDGTASVVIEGESIKITHYKTRCTIIRHLKESSGKIFDM